MKKFDSYKKCVIYTSSDSFTQMFDNDWSFTDIKNWMLDTYSIDIDSVVSIEFSSVTFYKLKKEWIN